MIYILTPVYEEINHSHFEKTLHYPIYDKNGQLLILTTSEIFSKVYQLKTQLKLIIYDTKIMENHTRGSLEGLRNLQPLLDWQYEFLKHEYENITLSGELIKGERVKYSEFLEEKIELLDKLFVDFQIEAKKYNQSKGFLTRSKKHYKKHFISVKNCQEQEDLESD